MTESEDIKEVSCGSIRELLSRLESLGFELSEIKKKDPHFLSFTYVLKGDESKLGDYPEYHSENITPHDGSSFSCTCCGHVVKVVPARFDDMADSPSEGLRWIRKEGKFGFADTSGQIVIDPQYDAVGAFSEGLAPVRMGGEWGYLDTANNILIHPSFEEVGHFSEGLAPFRKDGKWGFIDREGNVVVDPQFRYAYGFDNGVAVVLKGMTYYNTDRAGTLSPRCCKGITKSGRPCRRLAGLNDYCSSHIQREDRDDESMTR